MQYLCLGPNYRKLPSPVEGGCISSKEVGGNTNLSRLAHKISCSVCLIGEDYLVSGQPSKPLLNIWQVLILIKGQHEWLHVRHKLR